MFVKAKDWADQEVYINLDIAEKIQFYSNIAYITINDRYRVESKAEIKKVEKYIRDGRKE